MSASALTGALFCENKHKTHNKNTKQYKSEVLRMKKIIILFLVLDVFLVGVVAAVAYLIGCNYGHDNDGYSIVIDNDGYSQEIHIDNDGYSQEIHIDNDGYSIVIDNQEHLYNR